MSSQTNYNKKLRLNYFSLAFQLRYGLWLATIGVFCFFLMGFLMQLSIRHALQNSLHPDFAKELAGTLLSPSAFFMNYDVLLPAVILTIFLMAIGIVGTHRIAGPLYAIKRHMNRVRTGKTRQGLRLRRGDELLDLADALNAMMSNWWRSEKKVLELLLEIESDLASETPSVGLAKIQYLREKLQSHHANSEKAVVAKELPAIVDAKKAA